MSKVLNRSLKLGGDKRVINSITIQALEYNGSGNVLRCTGTTVPTGSGYAKGCLFIKTDAVTGTKGLYENQGTTTSASFNLVGSITGTELALGTSGTPLVHTAAADKAYSVYSTQASVDGAVSYEPVLFSTTMTGAGQVGGRVRAYMETDVALGGWANALKGEVKFTSGGRVTGLGSAICAEMTLPGAALTTGNYAPLEVELNLPTSFTTGAGTPTAFQFMSVQGDAKTQMDDSGYLFILNGLTAASGKLLQTNAALAATHALRVLIGGTAYYIMMTDTAA